MRLEGHGEIVEVDGELLPAHLHGVSGQGQG